MNHVCIVGRVARDLVLRYTNSQKAFAEFSVAVDRGDANHTADFINCVAWEKKAEFLEKYFRKGSRIGITGRIQTGSYERDGRKVYTTTVICETIEFVDSKKDEPNGESKPETKQTNSGFVDIPDDVNDGFLPFN